ncbi:unnamed protein product [Cylindrotheca closterium]|uniref:Uncharacterized protein n=1 Tax=Cylindrotheca closterium TaxID=2856 RepID=A0AAD2FYQ5_9STRA|nr:unnamed protein product [Cylindrotheca closterium]
MCFLSPTAWITFLATSQPIGLVFSNHQQSRRLSSCQSMAKPSDGDMQVAKSKRVVFLRHGRTYMNDFIGGVHFGAPNFSDIFPETPENKSKYIDSPLTPEGIKQAQNLKSVLQRTRKLKDYGANKMEERLFGSLLDEIDLVVVSPLTRALETMDIGLYPLIKARNIPIVANPLASERLYLVSDVGQARKELKKMYEYVDFDSCISDDDRPWHFQPTEDLKKTYVEWRPSGHGQVYACLGEPQDHFDRRMTELFLFLEERPERTIVLVCHAGVIDWFLHETFENCELGIVDFDRLTHNPRIQRWKR